MIDALITLKFVQENCKVGSFQQSLKFRKLFEHKFEDYYHETIYVIKVEKCSKRDSIEFKQQLNTLI